MSAWTTGPPAPPRPTCSTSGCRTPALCWSPGGPGLSTAMTTGRGASRATMRSLRPGRRQVDLVDATGDDEVLRGLVRDALAADPDIAAVYSLYAAGGNAATVAAFTDAGRACRVFVAHDLDAKNLTVLQEGHLSAVLHHDLALDLRRACHVVMQAHGALPGAPRSWHPGVQVVTPYNIPAEALSQPLTG